MIDAKVEEGEGEAYDVWPVTDAEGDSGNSTLAHSPQESTSSSPSIIRPGQLSSYYYPFYFCSISYDGDIIQPN